LNQDPTRRWRLETLEGCQLAIGAYPLFRYDARGGGGTAVAATGKAPPTGDTGVVPLAFAPEQLRIPALSGRTTTVLGLPLPPGLSITVVPMRLEGEVDPDGGSVALAFEAAFRFRLRLGGVTLLAPPDLQIRTCLRSGSPLSPTGATTLLGVATVPPCGAPWLDRFLGLPNQALAVLQCRLSPEPNGIL
jgi:hypothetical protein